MVESGQVFVYPLSSIYHTLIVVIGEVPPWEHGATSVIAIFSIELKKITISYKVVDARLFFTMLPTLDLATPPRRIDFWVPLEFLLDSIECEQTKCYQRVHLPPDLSCLLLVPCHLYLCWYYDSECFEYNAQRPARYS